MRAAPPPPPLPPPGPPETRDAFTERFLARVPADVAASFSQAQLGAIRHAFGLRHEPAHDVDLRRRFGRFYVVLLAGRDGRRGRAGA